MAGASQRLVEDRERTIAEFLADAGWSAASRTAIPGDASFRRYERLQREGDRAILMDAPPERENTALFVHAQRYLLDAGYRAPRLLHGAPEQGLLLLEDFGDLSVSKALSHHPREEEAIYRDAVDLLGQIAGQGLRFTQNSGGGFPVYDASMLMREIELFTEWLLPVLLREEPLSEASAAFVSLWRQLIARTVLNPEAVVHRDYHADNLFLLEGATGPARIGLLDFQDAVLGRAAYDLVSLLTDARRDVAPSVAQAMIARFLAATGKNEAAFRAEFAFYSAQRNAKILGIFARLYRRDGKPRYLDLLPRVYAHFEASLTHPSLRSLKEWRETYLPPDMLPRLAHLREELTGA